MGDVVGCAVYTPIGSETALLSLLPEGFLLLPQVEGDFGERLFHGIDVLLRFHDGVLLVNSDSPTLPVEILRAAVEAVREGDNVVLSPAADGGYTLIAVAVAPPPVRGDRVEHRDGLRAHARPRRRDRPAGRDGAGLVRCRRRRGPPRARE